MNISVGRFMVGCLLLLLSMSSFAQDSTKPVSPVLPTDSVPTPSYPQDSTLPHPGIHDSTRMVQTIDSAHKIDTIHHYSTDSARVFTDSTHHSARLDSSRHQARSLTAGPPAQNFSSRRRNGGGRQSPAIGHFYGKIVDAKTNKGMDGTSVQLVMSIFDTATHSRKDSVIRGAITQSNGEFSFESLPVFGNFTLKLTAIGYKSINQRVTFNLTTAQSGDPEQRLGAVDRDLGNIKMQVDPESLQTVTITAEKPLIQLGIDRKVYNVEKDLSASGGSAVDIMKNIPSLAVDIDGNVTLRNASPTIFVDGRPTTLTLDQIPADEIESVEIITNPGAKFDASGGVSGILNIVMKKNRKPGYNGAIRGGVDKRGGFNAGGNLNVKEGNQFHPERPIV
jgi:hypothetical protein